MLFGYVSNERYEALHGVAVSVRSEGERIARTTSDADGAIDANVAPGEYEVTLQKEEYGGKTVICNVDEDSVHQFRLLSTRILGYAWPKWVLTGEPVEYRVHAPEPVRVSLWRYGYEKERVRLIDWYQGEQGPWAGYQHVPDGDIARTGVKWPDPGPAHVPPSTVDAPLSSGLYYFHLETRDNTDFFSFPLVVAPRSPDSSLAVLAGTNTWNAYNDFGGRSNYVNAARLPQRPIANARQPLDQNRDDRWEPKDQEYQPLSFERPATFNHVPLETTVNDPIAGNNESHTAPAEWRTLGWLEREGYEYDLYADYQLHDGTLDLDAYDALVIHTHPEYWSRTMCQRVKEWVFERGGKLASLGGNSLGCEVVFSEDGASMRALNYDVDVYNETEDRPPGTYESRMDRTYKPESSLLGVVTTLSGMMTGAPYEVRAADHWIFEDTNLSDGDLFGTETLQERCSGGASGHETDKRTLNTPDEAILLAKGTNPDGGGAEMVYIDADGNGAVFATGSITYGPALLVDEDISQITRTILDKFME